MSLSLARTRVSVPDCVITRVVGESTVILDVDSGRSFTLDAIGTRVWTLLADTGSFKRRLTPCSWSSTPMRRNSSGTWRR
jgi:hypothetical protein